MAIADAVKLKSLKEPTRYWPLHHEWKRIMRSKLSFCYIRFQKSLCI